MYIYLLPPPLSLSVFLLIIGSLKHREEAPRTDDIYYGNASRFNFHLSRIIRLFTFLFLGSPLSLIICGLIRTIQRDPVLNGFLCEK